MEYNINYALKRMNCYSEYYHIYKEVDKLPYIDSCFPQKPISIMSKPREFSILDGIQGRKSLMKRVLSQTSPLKALQRIFFDKIYYSFLISVFPCIYEIIDFGIFIEPSFF